jgi:phage shock protein PspC (stress-responsive transcriptional regulator)
MDTSHSTFPDGDPGTGSPTLTAGPRPNGDALEPVERLHRIGHGRMVAGVAGGLADYFDVDPTIVRIGFVVLGFMGGLAIPAYVAGWLLIPEEGADQSVAEELLERERRR